MAQITLVVIFAISFLLHGYYATKAKLGIQEFANMVPFFPTAELCKHETRSYVWRDDYGNWDIRFKATLEVGEDPDTLCNCMSDYINQNKWLGAKCEFTCLRSPNCATLVLKGPSSSDYNPTHVFKPISSLCRILRNFETVEFGGHLCKAKCVPDGCLTRLTLQCELPCETSNPTNSYDKVVGHLNQNGLLAKANVTSNVDGEFLNIICLGD